MSLATDLRQAARSYSRSPGLAAALVLTVAAGAGGNGAVLAFIGGFRTHAAAVPDLSDPDAFARVTALLVSTSALVLLLASATVAGLLLSRASARTLDTAVRVSLGATRRRLVRQCFAESLLITATGGLIAVLFGWWASHLIPMLLFAEDASQMAWAPSVWWLGAATAIWIVVITACGMAPALVVSQRAPLRVLKGQALSVSGSARRFRTYLVIGQIALCALLLEMAGVIREDLHATVRTSRGQLVGSLLVVEVEATATFVNPAGGLRYLAAARDRIRTMPGVIAASWIGTLPGSRGTSQVVAVERPTTAWRDVRLDVTTFPSPVARPDRLRLVAGRLFGVRDGPDACRVAVINQKAADEYFHGDAIGRSLGSADGQSAEIIGVLTSPPADRSPRPTLYYYANQVPSPEGVSRDEVFYAPETVAPRRDITTDVNVA